MKKKLLSFFALMLWCTGQLYCQNTTISQKTKTERETAAANKVMLIPFEPRLYLGEIDMSIYNETKLTAKEIKYKFRDGLNEQLYKAFTAAHYNTLDLMEDTVRYKKDIEGIYQYLSYDFQKIPNQDNYQAPKKEKNQKKIEKGQLNVETNDQARFMNAKITSPKLVPLLYGKYKTNLFVFINQLDIRASGSPDPTLQNGASSNRRITVHYTVYTLDAREINSGVAEEEFESTLNNPKKIIDRHFSKIATTIVQRVTKSLTTPAK
jgi:hypothetical protein